MGWEKRKHYIKCRDNDKSKFLPETNSESEILKIFNFGGKNNKLMSVGDIKEHFTANEIKKMYIQLFLKT